MSRRKRLVQDPPPTANLWDPGRQDPSCLTLIPAVAATRAPITRLQHCCGVATPVAAHSVLSHRSRLVTRHRTTFYFILFFYVSLHFHSFYHSNVRLYWFR